MCKLLMLPSLFLYFLLESYPDTTMLTTFPLSTPLDIGASSKLLRSVVAWRVLMAGIDWYSQLMGALSLPLHVSP